MSGNLTKTVNNTSSINTNTILLNGVSLQDEITSLFNSRTADELTLNNTASLSGANTFTGSNTFNSGITVANTFTAGSSSVSFTCLPKIDSMSNTTSNSDKYAITTKDYVDTSLTTAKTTINTSITDLAKTIPTLSGTNTFSGVSNTFSNILYVGDLMVASSTSSLNQGIFLTKIPETMTDLTSTITKGVQLTNKSYVDNLLIKNDCATYSQSTNVSTIGLNSVISSPVLGFNTLTADTPIYNVSVYCNILSSDSNTINYTNKKVFLQFRHYFTTMNAVTFGSNLGFNQVSSPISSKSYTATSFTPSTSSSGKNALGASVTTQYGSQYLEGEVMVTLNTATNSIVKTLITAPLVFITSTGVKCPFATSYGNAVMTYYPFECTYIANNCFRIDVGFPNQKNNPLTANWIGDCGFSIQLLTSKLKQDSLSTYSSGTITTGCTFGSTGDAYLSTTYINSSQ